MIVRSLNGAWTLSKRGEAQTYPATVPGCVHTDLIAAGELDNPFYRDNEKGQMWIGETDWSYTCSFVVEPNVLDHDRVLLRCHGLDTLATVTINDTVIGRADNMFRTWEFDIKPVLVAGENVIRVDFDAPMPFARKMDAEKGMMAGWVEPMRINSAAWIRKEPCNFGWDWGPKMVTSGIWRDIELVAFSTARLSDVQVLQEHRASAVDLTVNIKAEQTGSAPLDARVLVSFAGQPVGEAVVDLSAGGTATAELKIDNPHLWWPNGMGDQPLYDVTVELRSGDVLDTWSRSVGLRTLTLERHPDEIGESFYFACNGVPFFAKGANWIPASPYPWEPQADDYDRLVRAAADANMNMLRAWGGGIYEHDPFFDACDRYGITVWQDFIFSCGTYPSFDAEFMANVTEEAKDNIRRLRHHPCMALWCGNNEIEQGMPDSPGWQESMSWADYSRLFDELLPSLVRELDPQRAYWPGSPHSPLGDRADHRNQTCGDTHLWDVWHGKQPYEWYRTRFDRFVSEFGFQSFPEPATVEEFTLPDDRNVTSYVMEHHQRSAIGNSTIIHYLLDWFRLPTSFESTLWLSQILQGLAMKYAVEHWRRNMPVTMGTLYWQHNDMWPAPSWASLDWKGNWKALHYIARHFYAPLLVSGVEDVTRSTVEIYVTSDLNEAVSGTVVCTVTDLNGRILEENTYPVQIAPRSNALVQTVGGIRPAREVMVWLELHVDNAVVSNNLLTMSRPKHLSLPSPVFQVDISPLDKGRAAAMINVDVPAMFVWLELPGAKFSDNFVHLRAGRPAFIEFDLPDGMSVVEASQRLSVRSLVDTYR
ncbi:MAG: glycoside hydrolase family 2 protein [Chloroflexi bacterium]|nr:glycoside hydrolase family 2 protein [Chloroflexota bacterium]